MLKNISTLGKTLSREAQQNIFGGSTRSPHCPDQCGFLGGCSDPNHSCSFVECQGDDGTYMLIGQCGCASAIGIK